MFLQSLQFQTASHCHNFPPGQLPEGFLVSQGGKPVLSGQVELCVLSGGSLAPACVLCGETIRGWSDLGRHLGPAHIVGLVGSRQAGPGHYGGDAPGHGHHAGATLQVDSIRPAPGWVAISGQSHPILAVQIVMAD